jgi:hypothetical protein
MKKTIIIVPITLTIVLTITCFFIYDNPRLNPDLNQENFFSEETFKLNLESKLRFLNNDLDKMRLNNEIFEKEMKLEFAYHSYNFKKAEQLNSIFGKMKYKSELFINKDIYRKTIIITGWTNKINMSNEAIRNWIIMMCELGHKFDSEFEAWIIKIDQSE